MEKINELVHGQKRLLALLDQLLKGQQTIMASAADLKADLDALKAGLTTKLQDLSGQIADLKAQLAAGTVMTPAQLDELDAEVKGMIDTVAPAATPAP